MNIDLQMKVRSNGWTSDSIKYTDLVRDTEQLVNMLDDLDFNVESVSLEFSVAMTYEQLMRFVKLVKKGAAHLYYHCGRAARPVPNAIRGDGEVYTVGDLFTAKPEQPLERNPVKMAITFNDVVTIKNQNIRGTTIMVNLGRLANAVAWAITHEVKLSDKPITLRTWNTITLWGNNPWKKDESKTDLDPELADVYDAEE